MNKYINKSKAILKVLGKSYKTGAAFTLTDAEEKRVSPAFLAGYTAGKKVAKLKKAEPVIAEPVIAESEAVDKETTT